LPIIISHFNLYPLISKKLADYTLFKLVFNLIINKEHLTIEGLNKIKAIQKLMNSNISSAQNFSILSLSSQTLLTDKSFTDADAEPKNIINPQ
jgi:hypothetical protein